MITARLGDQQEALIQEVVDWRERMIERLRDAGHYVNPSQVSLSLDQKTIPSWAGKLVTFGTLNLHDEQAVEQEVQARHPVRGYLRNADGSPKMVRAKIFPRPAAVQVAWNAKNDGKKWDLSLRIYDFQHGGQGASEPRFSVRCELDSLEDIFTKNLPLEAILDDMVHRAA